jgi:uncharacterized membrane protein YfcA
MRIRLADVIGMITTAIAGTLLGVVSLSFFGAEPTAFGFLALFLLARAATHPRIARNP